MTILYDVESRSRADLKRVGGRVYWRHPSTEVLCLSYHDTRRPKQGICTWVPGYPTPYWVGRDDPCGAHHGRHFDRFALARLGWIAVDSPRHFDTAELARRAGYPGALDALGTRLLSVPKDKDSSRFTKGLSGVRRPTKKTAYRAPGKAVITPDVWNAFSADEKRERGVQPEITEDVLAKVVAYCESDVRILVGAWTELRQWQDFEPEILDLCCAVNDTGVCFDVELAQALLEADELNGLEVCEEVAEWLEWDVSDVVAAAQSDQQFKELTGAPNAQKETVAALISDLPEGDPVRELARARASLRTIATGKLEAGLRRVHVDERLRDTQMYLGAHTWRWSGQGMQLQNLPRPDDIYEDWTDAQIDALARRVVARKHRPNAAEIDLLLRATICAGSGCRLAVADLAGIEARALSWCAGDAVGLRTIRDGLDAYKVEAAGIFGVPYDQVEKHQRRTGKVAVLACGYQGGDNAIRKMAKQHGVDLEAIGIQPRQIVRAWRYQHHAVVELWYALEAAFKAAVKGECDEDGIEVSCFTVAPSRDGRSVAIWMPSGTPIVYQETKLSTEQTPWGKTRESVSFHGRKGREGTYGGKLVENAIQRLCREIFAHGMVLAKEAGLRPVMTVHDEGVFEVPAKTAQRDYETLLQCMRTVPEWLDDDFPLDADGFTGKRYRK